MPRPYPTQFVGKTSYGVSATLDQGQLPDLQKSPNVQFTEILLEGTQDFPIVACLAGLANADAAADVAKLVIGAMIHASKTPPARAKIVQNAIGGYANRLAEWARAHILGETDGAPPAPPAPPAPSQGDGDEPEGSDAGRTPAPASNATSPPAYPVDGLPAWFRDLDISPEDMLNAFDADPVELAAYAGILAFCIAKQPTSANIEAFNQRRRNAISASMISTEMKIFYDESPYLTLDILGKVHRTFNLIVRDRALVMSAIVDTDDRLVSGTERMFYTIFRLSSGASMNPLLLITRFARKHPELYRHFPELETEYHAAAHALTRLFDVPESQRLYLKAIYGNAYVPVDRRDIDNLLGCARFVLSRTEKTLDRYAGGTLSETHRRRLIALLDLTEQEEEAPEEA